MARHQRLRALFIAALLVGKVVLWTWLLTTIGAERMVAYIGVENGYFVMFMIAFFGGLSTFTSVTYFATVITLASAGLNPVGLAFASSAGVTIGDAIFYYIGYFGLREVAAGRVGRFVARTTAWLERKPKIGIASFVYCYAAFTPLPNDILAMILGAMRQPLWLILPALVLGNATLTYLTASLGGFLPF